jgi:predicted PurR-regulated permease PerM
VSESWVATRVRARAKAERKPPKKPQYPPANRFVVTVLWLVRCPLGYYMAVTERAFILAAVWAGLACYWLWQTQRWLHWRTWARVHRTAIPGAWASAWWDRLMATVASFGIVFDVLVLIAGRTP